VSDEVYRQYLEKKGSVEQELGRLKRTLIKPSPQINADLQRRSSSPLSAEVSLEQLLKRPELSYGTLKR